MNTYTLALIGLLVIVLIIVSPFLSIWALNTIFPTLAIPMNVWTWLAVCWLHIVIGGSVSYKKS
jgi:hypothetical protein